MQYLDFRAMNSDIVLAADGKPGAVPAGFRLARQLIERSEQRFTRFSEESELSRLNRSAGTWFKASEEMFEVLRQAERLAVETGGLFNPAILPALMQAGYDRSMDELKLNPQRQNLAPQVVEPHDFRRIELEPATKSVRLPEGMQIDLGGIAKGWIAEQAAFELAKVSSACAVSAGGDLVLIGLPAGESAWEIGLENPNIPDQDLEILHVGPGAVATSSVAKRQWLQNGRRQHHLIDPRTGLPAQTDWLSVTVWAEKAVEAEVYAKSLLIAGPQEADLLFAGPSLKAYLAVDIFGQVHGSKNYAEVFHVQSQTTF